MEPLCKDKDICGEDTTVVDLSTAPKEVQKEIFELVYNLKTGNTKNVAQEAIEKLIGLLKKRG
jgi:hypothetical protein